MQRFALNNMPVSEITSLLLDSLSTSTWNGFDISIHPLTAVDINKLAVMEHVGSMELMGWKCRRESQIVGSWWLQTSIRCPRFTNADESLLLLNERMAQSWNEVVKFLIDEMLNQIERNWSRATGNWPEMNEMFVREI